METLNAGARGSRKREELRSSPQVWLTPNTDVKQPGSLVEFFFFFSERVPYVNSYEHRNYGSADIFEKQPFLNYFCVVFLYLVLLWNMDRC